jgi:hypothetical protein
MGFVVDKVALGQVVSEYFGFPCQFSFLRLLHIHDLSSGACIIGQLVADVLIGFSLTPPQETKKKETFIQDIQKFSVNAGLCSRLGLNLLTALKLQRVS